MCFKECPHSRNILKYINMYMSVGVCTYICHCILECWSVQTIPYIKHWCTYFLNKVIMRINFIPVAVTNFLCVVNKLFVMYFLEILKLPLHWNIFHTVAIYKSVLRIHLLTHHFYFFLSIYVLKAFFILMSCGHLNLA